MLGYLFAVISSLFYSLYVVPRKLSKLSPVIFSFFMAAGYGISAIVLYLFQPLLNFHETVSAALWVAVLAGIIWAAAFVCFVSAIDALGLARSNQWKNLQGPVAIFLSLLFLGEFAAINPFFAILAALAIFLSAVCFTIPSGHQKHIIIRGVALASLSALGFGTVAVLQKYLTSTIGVYSVQVVFSFSIATSLAWYLFLSKKLGGVRTSSKKDTVLGLCAGVLYLGASLFQLLSYTYLAASIAFTIIQLNTLWTVFIGIFIFKEINFGKHYQRVSMGFLLTIVGIILLAFARK